MLALGAGCSAIYSEHHIAPSQNLDPHKGPSAGPASCKNTSSEISSSVDAGISSDCMRVVARLPSTKGKGAESASKGGELKAAQISESYANARLANATMNCLRYSEIGISLHTGA